MTELETFLSNISVSVWAAVGWWLALCGVVAWLAHGKGRSAVAFFAIALLFSPVVGLLAVIAAHDIKAAAEANAANEPFKEMMVPLILNIDGIRGHLAVSNESNRPPSVPEAPPSQPRRTVQANGSAASPSSHLPPLSQRA